MPALAPAPKFRAVGADGLALVGGKLWSYTAGTSTPKATYTDFGLGTANTNPVILDARGEASVWLDGNYKLTLTDSADVQIWSVDDIRDLTSSATFTNATLAGTLTITSTAVTWSGNPTHSGNHTFTNNVAVNGNLAIGNASTDTLTIAPNAVTWTNGATHSGAHTWSGAVIHSGTVTNSAAVTNSSTTELTGVVNFSATPTGKVNGSNRIPTLYSVTNVATTYAGRESHFRIGDQVFGFGSFGVDVTAGASITTVGISVPIASAFTVSNDACGVASSAVSGAGGRVNAQIVADFTNDRLSVYFVSDGTGSTYVFSYSYGYRVI